MPKRRAPPGLADDRIAAVANALIRLTADFASFSSGG
jgi:hypothetical protein